MELYNFLLVLFCLIVLSESVCEFGPYTKSNGETICYFSLGDNLSWQQAKEQCQSQNARLPEIGSEQDNKYIVSIMPLLPDPWHGLWLSLNDLTTEGVFVWDSTNELPTYTNWFLGMPDDAGDNEDCATILNSELWNDSNCDFYNHVTFCESVQDPSTTTSTTTTAPIDCTLLANDKCDEATLTFVDRIPDIENMDDCQFFCDVIMADQCVFNILDKPQKQCFLIGSDFELYEQTCKRIHGVPMSDEDLAYCLTSQNPCDNFVNEECTITGNFQQELGATTVELCNAACRRTGCTYFSFDNEDPANPSCNMYTETTTPLCDLIRGPKSPPFSTC